MSCSAIRLVELLAVYQLIYMASSKYKMGAQKHQEFFEQEKGEF